MNNKTDFYVQLLSGKVQDLKSILDYIQQYELNEGLFFRPPYYEMGYLQHVVDFAEGRNEQVIILSPKTQQIVKIVYSYYLTLD